MGLAWNGTSILTQALHQPFDGPVLGWTWGAAVAGGVSFRYDRDGRLTALGDGGTTSDEHDYAYDPASLLLSTTVPAHPAWNAAYLYDPDRRVSEAAFPGQTPALTYDYRYDFNGNRTTRSYAGTQDTLTTPLASNRLLAFAAAGGPTAPRSLDAAGNLIDDGAGSTYAYGPDGRLEQADTPDGSESLAYDFAGRLRRRQVFTGLHPGIVFYAYDRQGRRLGVYTAAGQAIEEYAYLDDRLVALIRNGTVYPVLTDPNGSVRQVLDPATGSPLWTWEAHEPFGDTPPQAVNGFTFDARFPGQWHDDVTGLAFNGYRDYDPRTGRYIEPDPTGLASGPNPYAYVDGDPLSNTDSLGLACDQRGCWNTSSEIKEATSGDYADYYRNACGHGDNYACMAGEVAGAIRPHSAEEAMAVAFTNARLRRAIEDYFPDADSDCERDAQMSSKMEAIRIGLAMARTRQLRKATPLQPVSVSAKAISDFHNRTFKENGIPSDGWLPIFGGDIGGFTVSNAVFPWCSAPARHL